MELIKYKLADLKPAEYNPRKVLQPGDPEFEKIKNSIQEFGYIEPIVINLDLTIISGHQRRSVMMYLGYEEADCIVVDVGKPQEKALNIALNNITGEWDQDKLSDLIINIQELNIDATLTGFDVDEISSMIGQIDLSDISSAEDDGFDVDSVPNEPVSKNGQIFKLGNHRLMCGDCTDESKAQLLMEGEFADICITDPPYGVALGGHMRPSEAKQLHRRTDGLVIDNDNLDNEALRSFLSKAFRVDDAIMKSGAAFYIFHADNKSYQFRGAVNDIGWEIRQCLIWNKNNFTLGRQDYQWKHEPILYGWKPGSAHFWNSDRSQTTVLDFDRPKRSEEHPTMKPIPLIGYLIKNSSKKGDIVIDLFGGSGSTMIACEQLDRKCYMMEIDPYYCDVIIKRWETLTGKRAVLLNG